MVKYCIEKYPKGSWKGQQTPGRFMDGWLYKNLELLADKISHDMTFLGIIYSSTLEVGTGKSVFATQIGEAWTEIVNKKYNLKIPYDIDNLVWRPKDLIDKSMGKNGFKKIPKYSYVLVDEWEDATYWSELGMTLRQFFRKCRQLNLFIMCIIPNWFQLPLSYAVSRSVFAIDVRFNDKLDRGFFAFYNFPAKRFLYVNGKRNHNYYAAKPTFMGRFPDGYGVDELKYRKRKYDDMVKYDEEHPEKKTSKQLITERNIEILKKYLELNPKATLKECGILFGVSKKTISNWKLGGAALKKEVESNYINKLTIKKEIIVDEDALEQTEKEKGVANELELDPPTN